MEKELGITKEEINDSLEGEYFLVSYQKKELSFVLTEIPEVYQKVLTKEEINDLTYQGFQILIVTKVF